MVSHIGFFFAEYLEMMLGGAQYIIEVGGDRSMTKWEDVGRKEKRYKNTHNRKDRDCGDAQLLTVYTCTCIHSIDYCKSQYYLCLQ